MKTAQRIMIFSIARTEQLMLHVQYISERRKSNVEAIIEDTLQASSMLSCSTYSHDHPHHLEKKIRVKKKDITYRGYLHSDCKTNSTGRSVGPSVSLSVKRFGQFATHMKNNAHNINVWTAHATAASESRSRKYFIY